MSRINIYTDIFRGTTLIGRLLLLSVLMYILVSIAVIVIYFL